MPRVIAALVRHGDYHQLENTPSAFQPFPLNSEGEQQAITGSDLIRKTAGDNNWVISPYIDSSQLLRAWQTADIISKCLSDVFDERPQINEFPALAERSVGSVANLSKDKIEEIVELDPRYEALPKDWKSNSHYCLPFFGAESLMQAGERALTHIETQMICLSEVANVDTLKIFVGHGAAFRHAAHLMEVLAFDDIAALSMYHAVPVFIEYLPEIGSWKQVGGKWKVRQRKTEYTD